MDNQETSWMGTDDILHEPLFGLIPVSCLFLLMAIVLASLEMTFKLRKRR